MANASATPPTRADVYAALARRSGFEVIQETETDGQLRVVGRLATARWAFFVPIVFVLLKASKTPGHAWACDISKQYIEANDQVRYAWRLIFQASDGIARHYGDISSVIRSAPAPARVEVNSIRLPGYKEGQVRGGVNEKGKGVSAVGSLPLALTRGGPRG